MSSQLQRIFGQVNNLNSFDAIRVSISSPERIRSWSFGEVKKPETINYRTFKPERDGLFCPKIFGPTKDYECLCGKYKRMKYRGVICEKCGVEVTLSKVRRERMGHIELVSPVAHIWFTKTIPSRLALVLDLTANEVEKVLYFDSYIVIDPGMTPFEPMQLISEEEYYGAQDTFGEDSFKAGTGAEALRELLMCVDLHAEQVKLREELHSCTSDMKRRRLVKRLKLIEAFISSGNKPEWMIMTCIPVIPPDLRPLVPLDGGRFAASDLNDLYRRIINRNNRLKRLLELHAPDIIVKNEKRMLQESVDALFDNGRRGRVITGANKRPLKSLSESLKGKQGRFRQNLLGKRVDYSGRSVIVVGPNLKLHQCGLPKRMALELFKPFVYSKLERYGFASTLKSAKRLVDLEKPEVWDILEEVIKEHPVLLNRAPTLHRLGIQAFEPVLVEGKAIRLHPLVCTAFNADFDGDQMAVHVPLSVEAQLEARVLMLATNNILSPANGKTIIVPTKDIILGVYYLTMALDKEPGEGMVFSGLAEINHALENKVVTLHSKIKARYQQFVGDGITKNIIVDTTPGRYILAQILPKNEHVNYELVNKLLTSKDVGALIDYIYRYCGQKDTVVFVDKIKEIGYHYSTIAGISIGKDDMYIPPEKQAIVGETSKAVAEYEKQYLDGLITAGEKYNKAIDAWSTCADKVAETMMQGISKIEPGKPVNSIYMMAHSGARGSAAQMRQVSGMRGLMAKPSGEIIETPIISNFKEGLAVLEYFTSTHGARKGMTDTALKTANSGYLTRRLVDVAQDCVITKIDCGTKRGIDIKDVLQGSEVIASLAERIIGRAVVDDVLHPDTNEVILKAGELVDEDACVAITEAGISEVKIRSVLTCECEDGICAKCYGRDLSRRSMIGIGEAVGVIAAQSIGEPGTQLTMRTFHVGGTAQKTVELSSVESAFDGVVSIANNNVVNDVNGNTIVMNRHLEVIILDSRGKERSKSKIPYGAFLYVSEGQQIKKGDKIADWDPFTVPVVSEKSGVVHYVDLIDGVSLKQNVDDATGITNYVVSDWRQNARNSSMRPMVVLMDDNANPIVLSNGQEARYLLSPDTVLAVANGDHVNVGDVIARLPRQSSKTKDITGGLPRVSELFEARQPKDSAVISELVGYVSFGKDYKGKRNITITSEDGTQKIEYLVQKWRNIVVQEGDFVNLGDVLVDGTVAPHDILNVLGVEALAEYMVNEIQEVYRLQGVKINDKHIEVIVRQMLRKVEVVNPGDTTFVSGEQVDLKDFQEENKKTIDIGGTPATAKRILQGITKASLQTHSFISAASFQETTRVLTDAALEGKIDELKGLKENVLVGRLIPAGTGFVMDEIKRMAIRRDFEVLEAQKQAISSSDSFVEN